MRDERGNETELLRYLNALRNCVGQSEHSERTGEKGRAEESGQIFRAIFENATDGILVVDVESKTFCMGNRVLCQMLGYSQQELRTLGIGDIHPEENLADITEKFEEQVREERTLAGNIPVKRKDGSIFYADINSFPVTLGQKTYLMGIFRDITKHKRAEEELRRSEETFRLAMEATNDALWDWNIVTNHVYRNPRHDTMLGFEPGKLTASQEEWERRIHPDDQSFIFGMIDDMYNGKRDTFFAEYRLLTKSGDYIWVLGRGKVIAYNPDGSPARMIGTNVDITERKKAENELRKFKTVADGAGHGVAMSDLEGRLSYVNEPFAQMHGYEASELVGCNLSMFHDKEQMERVNQLNQRLKEAGSYVSEEVWHTRKDGTVFCALMNGTLIRDEHGAPRFMAATVVDITHRKNIETTLAENEEKYRTLVECAGESIATIGENGVFLFMNRIGAERLGGKPDDYIGKTMWDLFPKEIADRQMATVRRVIQNKQAENLTVLTEIQGEPRWYNTTIQPLTDWHGKVATAMVIARDIHAFKQAEDQLNAYREHLARAEQLASLGTLSATLAHQINQPLTVIRLSLDNVVDELERTSCSSAVFRKLRDSITQVSNITAIINRFRNFARQSSDTALDHVSVHAVAIRVARLLAESARQARVTLHVDDMSILPAVLLHESEFEQILFALVENAIQAADGEKDRRIIISGAVENEQIELRFSDDCGGIPPENLEKIFDPFFTTKPRGQGTGLGLCIVRDAVARVGGRVRVESEWGRGSTFFVSFPVDDD